MKTTFLFLLFVLSSSLLFSQNIPNGDFENWGTYTLHESPQGFETTNFQSFLMNKQPNVTKDSSAHGGNFSVKIRTNISGNDTAVGILTNGSFIHNISGGIPFTSLCDTVSFWVHYNVQPGDTAIVAFLFSKMGTPIGYGVKKMVGSNNGFEKTSLYIGLSQLGIAPDSMLFVASSSNADYTPKDGSWLMIDDLSVDGNPLPNGGFETWIQHSYEDAVNWNSFNFVSAILPVTYVQKSTDAYSGNFAMKITTRLINNNQDTLTHITNGNMMMDNFSGGMKVFSNPLKLTGYYKYTPLGFDSALVAVKTSGIDHLGNYKEQDVNLVKLPPAANYTAFSIDFHYNGWPPVDTLGIGFAASNIHDGHSNAHEGSTLLLDSLNLIYMPVGMEENKQNQQITAFPNPANESLKFLFKTPVQDFEIIVFNSLGQRVSSDKNVNVISTAHLPDGMYYYQIQYEGNIHNGRFTVKH